VEKAEHDLITAEHTLSLRERCPYDMVCFHAQQCAEKYLKALLLWRSVRFPRTHDLRYLMELIPTDLTLGFITSRILPLDRYSVDTRYPDAWDDIERPEAERALALAHTVREAVRVQLPARAL
jgi:HEPN domain-containing protein